VTAWRALDDWRGANGSWAVILLADADPAERAMTFSGVSRRFTDPATGITYSVNDTRLLAWRMSTRPPYEPSRDSGQYVAKPRLNGRAIGLMGGAFLAGGCVGWAISYRSGDIGDIALMAAIFGVFAIVVIQVGQRIIMRRTTT
jgi:hypothetical protein